VRIDRSDPTDGPADAHEVRRAQSAPDDPDAASKGTGKPVSGDDRPDASSAHPDSDLRAERAAYRAVVDAAYRQHDIDHGHARAEKPERETVTSATHRIDAGRPKADQADLDDHPKVEGRQVEATGWEKVESLQTPGGDVPDDPRNYSNPKTGRFDASWSGYDRAIAAAREHSGGDLGPDSIKMYDQNLKTREGTGTLIGEQTPDRLRGWRIDGQDGHVNWWDWTGGKKGAGGAYGHDWFPQDQSVPGSRYIGWAPWQDSNGNILEGN
jgi:hypothetical protein